jgi:hypothetical protein
VPVDIGRRRAARDRGSGLEAAREFRDLAHAAVKHRDRRSRRRDRDGVGVHIGNLITDRVLGLRGALGGECGGRDCARECKRNRC